MHLLIHCAILVISSYTSFSVASWSSTTTYLQESMQQDFTRFCSFSKKKLKLFSVCNKGLFHVSEKKTAQAGGFLDHIDLFGDFKLNRSDIARKYSNRTRKTEFRINKCMDVCVTHPLKSLIKTHGLIKKYPVHLIWCVKKNKVVTQQF